MTQVLVLNSSPNLKRGGTASILGHFIRGMEEVGAEIDVLNLTEMDISPCKGCMACWWKTPGVCVQKDDMVQVYTKLREADILILATPLYVDGMNAQMKAAVDRFLALCQPFFEVRDGHCRHPHREGYGRGKLVLVSVCGFHEMDNFNPLVMHVKAIGKNMGRKYSGAVLRPYARLFPFLKMKGVDVDGVYEDVRIAGLQLIRDGEISPETSASISRDLVTREQLVDGINASFRMMFQAGSVMRVGSNIMSRISRKS